MSASSPSTSQANTPYEGLSFSFAKMEMEIDNMRKLAKPFLERDSFETVIPDWKTQLTNFKNGNSDKPMRWNIAVTKPIQTIISNGQYEPRGRRGKDVFGCISGSWDIQTPQAAGRGGAKKSFILHGLASTEITIWERLDGKPEPQKLMHWTVEVGDSAAPGCHFHTQIKCGMEDKPISVPRLPTLLMTPMDALEFLLSELFQDEWGKHAAKENDYCKIWASCQRPRLTKLLEWQLQQVKDAGGSPWTYLKRQKPTSSLFLP